MSPGGKTTYTDRPCETGDRRTGVVITDNKVDGSELRNAAARSRAELGAAKNQPIEADDDRTDTRDRSSSFECGIARREYELEASIKTNPDTTKMERRRQAAEEVCGAKSGRAFEHEDALFKQKVLAERKARAEEAARSTSRFGSWITDCNAWNCYDSKGNAYKRGNGGDLIRSDGKSCTASQGALSCL
jgi:hypothetical protein